MSLQQFVRHCEAIFFDESLALHFVYFHLTCMMLKYYAVSKLAMQGLYLETRFGLINALF